MKRRPVITVGLALVVGCTGAAKSTDPQTSMDTPTEEAAAATEETIAEATADAEPDVAPAEEVPEVEPLPVDPSLPTWEEVGSKHPPGATNPPRPALTVTPDGRCYKRWVSPMIGPKAAADKVMACEGEAEADCGTAVQCPERAAQVLAAHQADEDATPPAE
ncbi:MAG: hypothetical protein KTR31_25440 [Myxococcales bacterium]|nr:hypothetical protein [Myxococcales bacterium]